MLDLPRSPRNRRRPSGPTRSAGRWASPGRDTASSPASPRRPVTRTSTASSATTDHACISISRWTNPAASHGAAGRAGRRRRTGAPALAGDELAGRAAVLPRPQATAEPSRPARVGRRAPDPARPGLHRLTRRPARGRGRLLARGDRMALGAGRRAGVRRQAVRRRPAPRSSCCSSGSATTTRARRRGSHLDLGSDDIEADADRLVALGAELIGPGRRLDRPPRPGRAVVLHHRQPTRLTGRSGSESRLLSSRLPALGSAGPGSRLPAPLGSRSGSRLPAPAPGSRLPAPGSSLPLRVLAPCAQGARSLEREQGRRGPAGLPRGDPGG